MTGALNHGCFEALARWRYNAPVTSRVEQYARRLIEAGWLASVIVVPLFFNVWSNRVFEPDKLALLRSIALVMVAAGLAIWLEVGVPSLPEIKRWLRQPMVLPVLIMSASMGLSSAISIVPRLSVFGSYNRLQGLYSWLAYVVLFLAIVATLRQREQLDRLILAVILPSLPVGLYGIVQKFGLDPMPWLGDVTRRVASTLGNSIFVSAYLIMAVPLTAARLLTAVRALEKDESHSAVLRVSGYLVLLAVQVMAVIFSQSRGPLLGLLGAAFFLALVIAAARGRKATLAVLGLGAAVAGFLVVFNLPSSPLAPLREVPYLGRMGRVFETDRSTGRVRVLIWQGTVELIRSNPWRAIVGYGPESMHVAYNPFYPPDLAHYESRNASPDRSHNETLDVIVQTGLLGLAASLFLFTGLFYYGLKWLGLIESDDQRRRFLAFWFGGGLLAMAGFYLWAGNATFLGVALPAGLMAGLLAFVAVRVLSGWRPDDTSRALVLAALVACLIAHYIEIHFGIAIAATRTLFFVMTGALVAVGSVESLRESPALASGPAKGSPVPERRRRTRPTQVVATTSTADWLRPGFIVLAITVTLIYDLLVVTQPQRGSFWLVLGWILGLAWGLGLLIIATETLAERPGRRSTPWSLVSLSLVGTFVYLLVHALLLASGAATGGGPVTSSALLAAYYAAMGIVLLAWAFVLAERDSPMRLAVRPVWAHAGLLVLAAVLALFTNFRKIQADIYYKSAYYSYHDAANKADDRGEHERALALYAIAQKYYDTALRLDPNEDYYMLFKGKGLLEQASGIADALREKLGERADEADFSEYQLEGVDPALAREVSERDRVFQAAIDVLRKALATAPRNTDHYANLGRAFQVWGDETFDARRRSERLAESRHWFEEAIRLSPNNAQLREELATTEYLAGDRAAALKRIEEALDIDPQYGRPYRLRGTIHREAQEWEAAAADYQAYVQTRDGRGDAYGWSALAYVLGQLGKLQEARQANEKVLELVAPRQDLSTLRNLVLISRDLGDQTTACDYLGQALALAPEDAELLELEQQLNCPEMGEASGPGEADVPAREPTPVSTGEPGGVAP